MHIFIFSPTALVRGNPARAKFATESHVDTLVMVVLHCCYLKIGKTMATYTDWVNNASGFGLLLHGTPPSSERVMPYHQ